MGRRACTSHELARIDPHVLSRQGVARLCYCGPVLHAKPEKPHATREPLQFGSEIYGHSGLAADVEILTLARQCLEAAGVTDFTTDVADIRIVRRLLDGVEVAPALLRDLHGALARKDGAEIGRLTRAFPESRREGLRALS